jgi:hypothetical protein
LWAPRGQAGRLVNARMELLNPEEFAMRAPCKCGHPLGRIEVRNGQNTVRCLSCNLHCYNAPKHETGEKPRSVQSRPGLSPERRAFILERARFRCELCGLDQSAGVILHVGHILSVKEGRDVGASDEEIYHDDNLLAECEECNLGHGKLSLPALLIIRLIKARIARAGR